MFMWGILTCVIAYGDKDAMGCKPKHTGGEPTVDASATHCASRGRDAATPKPGSDTGRNSIIYLTNFEKPAKYKTGPNSVM